MVGNKLPTLHRTVRNSLRTNTRTNRIRADGGYQITHVLNRYFELLLLG